MPQDEEQAAKNQRPQSERGAPERLACREEDEHCCEWPEDGPNDEDNVHVSPVSLNERMRCRGSGTDGCASVPE